MSTSPKPNTTSTDTATTSSTSTPTLTLTCHCNLITITFPYPPKPLNQCLCSICGRYAALWSYHPRSAVQITNAAETETYVWGVRETEFHRCKACGCVTHWAPVDQSRDRVGINCRLLERGVLEGLSRKVSRGPEDDSDSD